MEDMLKDFMLGEHLLLVGNQGVGKNKIVDRFLYLLNRPREYLQLHRHYVFVLLPIATMNTCSYTGISSLSCYILHLMFSKNGKELTGVWLIMLKLQSNKIKKHSTV